MLLFLDRYSLKLAVKWIGVVLDYNHFCGPAWGIATWAGEISQAVATPVVPVIKLSAFGTYRCWHFPFLLPPLFVHTPQTNYPLTEAIF